jgi:hypothetical protein
MKRNVCFALSSSTAQLLVAVLLVSSFLQINASTTIFNKSYREKRAFVQTDLKSESNHHSLVPQMPVLGDEVRKCSRGESDELDEPHARFAMQYRDEINHLRESFDGTIFSYRNHECLNSDIISASTSSMTTKPMPWGLKKSDLLFV